MITIYEVLAHDIVEYPDMDCVMQSRYEEVYDNMFTSRVNAIAKAQSLFAKKEADWVRVIELTVGEHGIEERKRIYNKCNLK